MGNQSLCIKNERLKEIKKKLIKFPFFSFLGKGRRGIVYKISSDLIVKIERDDIATFNTIKNEFDILKIIGKHKYFPKVYNYNEKLRYIIREFVDGILINQSLNKKTILSCLDMCYVLDNESINQQELTNPFKHIYVKNDNVMMIDFERAKKTINPKNVSQFIQYIIKNFQIRNNELLNLVKKYKINYDKKSFEKIKSFLVKLDFIH